jgi:predicted dehydrogenase
MATHVHADKTQGEDDSICILEFENGAVGLIEDSWVRRGGMADRIEVYGEGGVTYADLHMGNALPTYSEYGYGYAVEGKEQPQATGEDGRLVQEVLCAGYQSAATGTKVELPFRPGGIKRPIDLWLKRG